MSNITNALVIVMSINVVFFLAQIGMTEINPLGTQFYNCEGNIMSEFEIDNCQGEYYLVDDSKAASALPEGEGSVSPETGNFFTDIFNSARSWLVDSAGIGYLVGIVSAPVSFLNSIGLPAAFVFAIGTLWYSITFFLFIAWLLGRDS